MWVRELGRNELSERKISTLINIKRRGINKNNIYLVPWTLQKQRNLRGADGPISRSPRYNFNIFNGTSFFTETSRSPGRPPRSPREKRVCVPYIKPERYCAELRPDRDNGRPSSVFMNYVIYAVICAKRASSEILLLFLSTYSTFFIVTVRRTKELSLETPPAESAEVFRRRDKRAPRNGCAPAPLLVSVDEC